MKYVWVCDYFNEPLVFSNDAVAVRYIKNWAAVWDYKFISQIWDEEGIILSFENKEIIIYKKEVIGAE